MTDLDAGNGATGIGPFAVDHVLVSELPTSIGTIDAPERYTVAAVFRRRPDPVELAMLAAPAVVEQLTAAGYPEVTLSIADRRLLIGNTDLHELEAGLAHVVGRILADIGEQAAANRVMRVEALAERSQREADRAAAVVTAAKRISFAPTSSMYR